jgi:hypothetical protein
MTKPLTVFLELAGGAVLIYGIAQHAGAGEGVGAMVLGCVMFLAGMFGHRKREKANAGK